ncbi:acyl-CoA/acyl-ACP dehydrogenase (plasmid) [Streptomyces sp. NBC_01003]|uniref:acyl-CoA dehydrogenase family protein n=1 Tax=Streptomyces sp. NBC_01003 TaxID=2903714 RepID=UPI002F915820|nr:acyl-CoA/acyl-ACP dehydrogenase [Streptomyces sp. NBC_01003]
MEPALDSALLDVLREASVRTARTGRADEAALRAVRASGLLGLAVPVGFGGAGGSAATVNAVLEEVARVDPSMATVLFQHFAVSARIGEWGTPAQQARLLPRMAAGWVLAASAWSETGAGAAKERLAATARAGADGSWTLDGVGSFTTGAGIADLYLVLVQTSEAEDGSARRGSRGQTFFLVPADNPGLTPEPSPDPTGMRGSATGCVALNGCRVADGDRLGPLGGATEIIAGVRETGSTLGAVSAGIARAVLDLALAHFGRAGLPAGSPRAARLVELATSVEAARAVVASAGRRGSAGPGTTTLHSKLFASQAAEQIALDASRLLGPVGHVTDHRLGTLLADARAVTMMGPANHVCRELIAASLQR